MYAPPGVEGMVLEPLVISGSTDNTSKVWSLRNRQCMHTLEGHKEEINCLAVYAPVGVEGMVVEPLVISGSTDNTSKVWSLRSRQCVHTLEGLQFFKGYTGSITCLAVYAPVSVDFKSFRSPCL